jgi:hypothetical protein
MSKTPQFDAALDEILKSLVPHAKNCGDCKKEFEITAEDIEFLNILRVPAPKLCPICRKRRRLTFANYSNIYRRKCDAPGHTDTMISLTAPIIPWVMYDYDTYYGDSWDPRTFGRAVEPEKSFFSQYFELLKVIPHPGVRRGPGCVNSDFAFYGRGMKDCYYVFGGWNSESLLYSTSIFVECRNIVDSYYIRKSDTLYENVTTANCFKCNFVSFSTDCIESDFLYDCRNCANCFGCVNLRNKKYCWFNEQLTKEEYQKRRASVDLGSRKVLKKYKEKFWEFVRQNPIRATRTRLSENVTGNDIVESNNCYQVFQAEHSDHLRYGQMFNFTKDSMDVSFAGYAERLYETQNVGMHSANVKFSFACKEVTDSEYAMSCNNCSNLFGCIGLKNTSYAIFNTVYEPVEYFKKVDAIKTKMLESDEYGEFFPMLYAPYPYNSSLAHIIFPMTKEEVLARGLFWQEDIETDTKNISLVSIADLPDNIKDVESDITSKAVVGERSQKPFRFTPQEITFYKTNAIALPTLSPYERIMDRFAIMNNLRLVNDHCFECSKAILSAHDTNEGYKPFCAECFRAAFE